jgi:hypothetical protein
MDEDLDAMTREQLKESLKGIRGAVRAHRDSKGHNLCWFWPEMWKWLPEHVIPSPEVPDACEFMEQCAAFRRSLNKQAEVMGINTAWGHIQAFGTGKVAVTVFKRRIGGLWEYAVEIRGDGQDTYMMELEGGNMELVVKPKEASSGEQLQHDAQGKVDDLSEGGRREGGGGDPGAGKEEAQGC